MLTKAEQQVLDNVEKYGYSVIHVAESYNGSEEEPGFSYSIGLFKTYQLPEIIIIGLDHELQHSLIHNISEEYENGNGLKVGALNSDIIEHFDCMVVEVEKEHYAEYLGWASWFYKNEDFPAVQIVYPDKLGCFPWDKDFSRQIVQPVLNKNYESRNRT